MEVIMLSENWKEILDKNFYLRFPIEYGIQLFTNYYKVNGGYSEMTRAEKAKLDTLHHNLLAAKVFTGRNTAWEDFRDLYEAM